MGFVDAYSDSEPTRAEIDAIPGPLVLEFGAPWCGHCLAVQATLAKLMKRSPEIRHVKVYDGRGQPLGRSFRVKLWPNLIFMRDGKVLFQVARANEAEILKGLNAITADAIPG